MVFVYCAWPSFSLAWMRSCRRLAARKEFSLARFFALDAIGSSSGQALCRAGLSSSRTNWMMQFVGYSISGPRSGLRLGFRSVSMPAGGDWSLVRMILELRHRRISPPVLAHKLKSNGRVAVLDLANFEGDIGGENVEGIPGAFVVDPSVLRKATQIAVPDDVKVILYCPSGSDAVSARAAMA